MNTRIRTCRKREAFTKVGVIICISVFAFLISLLVVGVNKARDSAARTQCINNLKALGLGMLNFEGTFKRIPPLYGGGGLDGDYGASIKFPRVWAATHFFIKPYVDPE